MTAAGNPLMKLYGRLALALTLLAFTFSPTPASAEALTVEHGLCHAASGLDTPDAALAARRFSCGGLPTGYHRASLWLRTDPAQVHLARSDLALMVHQSRFDRLAVAFTYADGVTRWQQVRQGDYGSHWRAGRSCSKRPSAGCRWHR